MRFVKVVVEFTTCSPEYEHITNDLMNQIYFRSAEYASWNRSGLEHVTLASYESVQVGSSIESIFTALSCVLKRNPSAVTSTYKPYLVTIFIKGVTTRSTGSWFSGIILP